MNDDTVTVEVDIRERIDVNIYVSDVLYAINQKELKDRWSAVATLLNGIRTNEVDDDEPLTAEQTSIIIDYLKKKLDFFQPSMPKTL